MKTRKGIRQGEIRCKGKIRFWLKVTNGGEPCTFARVREMDKSYADGRYCVSEIVSTYRSQKGRAYVPKLMTMDERHALSKLKGTRF